MFATPSTPLGALLDDSAPVPTTWYLFQLSDLQQSLFHLEPHLMCQ